MVNVKSWCYYKFVCILEYLCVHLYIVIYMVGALFYILLEHFDIHCWDNYLRFLHNSIHYCWYTIFIHCWYTILYIVRAVCIVVPGEMPSISWRGFYVLTELTFIHPNIKFYALSTPYLVERF
jgi:hypothetical protein